MCFSGPAPLRQVLQAAKHPLHSSSTSSSEKQQVMYLQKTQRALAHANGRKVENTRARSYSGGMIREHAPVFEDGAGGAGGRGGVGLGLGNIGPSYQ